MNSDFVVLGNIIASGEVYRNTTQIVGQTVTSGSSISANVAGNLSSISEINIGSGLIGNVSGNVLYLANQTTGNVGNVSSYVSFELNGNSVGNITTLNIGSGLSGNLSSNVLTITSNVTSVANAVYANTAGVANTLSNTAIIPASQISGLPSTSLLYELNGNSVGNITTLNFSSDFSASNANGVVTISSITDNSTMLFDKLTTANVAVAYSVRRLTSKYTGALLRVQRSSDSTQLDIGYTSSGLLDVNTLLTFIGAGTGSVVTWYDQSGNGLNATSAMSHPPTFNNLQIRNGNLPTLYFSGGSQFLTTATTTIPNSGNNFSQISIIASIPVAGAKTQGGFVTYGAYTSTNMRSLTNSAAVAGSWDTDILGTSIAQQHDIPMIVNNTVPVFNTVSSIFDDIGIRMRVNDEYVGGRVVAIATSVNTAINIGSYPGNTGYGGTGTGGFINSYISEVIVLNSRMSLQDQKVFEKDRLIFAGGM